MCAYQRVRNVSFSENFAYVLNAMRCAIWYHFYNLKNVENTHGGVLISVKLTLPHGCFSLFLNCKNGTKSRNAPQMNDPLLHEDWVSRETFAKCFT